MAGQDRDTPLARLIGRSRLIVVVAVLAVLLAAFSLFLLGAWLAVSTVWSTWSGAVAGSLTSTEVIIRFLEIVTVMLKAVFFYLIGVGFYSLFISPLNVTVALGVETLNDLETKIISVIIVIMAVNFLERFIQCSSARTRSRTWRAPFSTARSGLRRASATERAGQDRTVRHAGRGHHARIAPRQRSATRSTAVACS